MAYVISLSPEDAARFAELWRANTTNNELRKIFGISEQTIQRISKQLGLQPRFFGSAPKFDWSQHDGALIEMVEKKWRWSQIADALGVSCGAARHRWVSRVRPRLMGENQSVGVQASPADRALCEWVRALPAHHPVQIILRQAHL